MGTIIGAGITVAMFTISGICFYSAYKANKEQRRMEEQMFVNNLNLTNLNNKVLAEVIRNINDSESK